MVQRITNAADAVQIGEPHLVIVLACNKHLARNRFINRGRGGANVKVFEQRYEEYVEKQSIIEKKYENKIAMVCRISLLPSLR